MKLFGTQALHRHRSHRTARFGAFAARCNALFHTADLFAGLRASFADVSAFGTNVGAVSRPAQHEVGARLADLRAVHHQAEVSWLGVLAAHFQTMTHRLMQAHAMTIRAVLNALLHPCVHVFVVHFVPFLDARK